MRKPVTIDASVFVRAASPAEGGYGECRDFLLRLAASACPVVLPTLVKPEVASAVRRATGSESLAAEMVAGIDALGGVVMVPLDASLADEAAELCIRTGLRGADAVYTATARRFDAVLVTVDREQRERVPADITAVYPAEALGRTNAAAGT
jgi:predicted nucleic acid-binding protein